MFNLALPLAGFRTGRLGNLPVDADYMAGVKARARMLQRACRLVDGEPAVEKQPSPTGNGSNYLAHTDK